MAEKKDESIVLNTKKVEEIIHKENMGVKLKNYEKLWFTNIKGVRKSNIPFAMTDDEVTEYMKCKMSVHYFAQKYCQIKREDGSIGNISLRDYQKDIIDLYTENRFSILMASRQTGKCSSFNIKVLCKTNEGKIEEKTLGELYYSALKQVRKLTFLEHIKYSLYRLYELYTN